MEFKIIRDIDCYSKNCVPLYALSRCSAQTSTFTESVLCIYYVCGHLLFNICDILGNVSSGFLVKQKPYEGSVLVPS